MRSLNLLVLLPILVSACAAGLTVSKGFNAGADATEWQDYAWLKSEDGASDPRVDAAHDLIRREIDTQLSAKGYRLTSKNDADFLVSHSIFAHWQTEEMSDRELEAIEEQAMMTGQHASDLEYSPREHGEGMLNVVFSSPQGKAAWSGRVETPLDYRGEGARKIPVAVKQLLADFPAR